MADFFIERPKFAFVISILITLGGLISLSVLPVSEFPDISPPQVSISASYPGTNVEVIEDTVAGRSSPRSTASTA